MFALEKDRKTSPSWAKVVIEAERLQAHSFFAHSAFSDVMVHALAYMAIFSPIVAFALSQFPDVVEVEEGNLGPTLSWALSGVLAVIGLGLLYGHRAAPVEHFLTYDPAAKALETTAFNRKGARVAHATIRADDVKAMFLVDDEGTRRQKQTHPATDVALRVVAGKKTHTLLSGREADIWPVYLRMLDLLPNVTR